MTISRAAAFRREREELLAQCTSLDHAAWKTPSRAEGWRVQDVVAHMAAGCHALFSPQALTILRSDDIERTNDEFVDRRRGWEPQRVVAEYARWSARAVRLASVAERTPLGRVRLPLGELGRFPAALLIGGAMAFDHHTHLRHDIAPAIGFAPPPTDGSRLAVVLEWMFAVLSHQLEAVETGSPAGDVGLVLTGPGGGSWTLQPGHGARPGLAAACDAVIRGRAVDFPSWGTRRTSWRDHDVDVDGDHRRGTAVLDQIRVV